VYLALYKLPSGAFSAFKAKLTLRRSHMDNWIKVERGIRYREHPTRKHGVPKRPDRYYVIRLAVDGLMRQEALGWESGGLPWTKPVWSLLGYGRPSVAG